MKKSVFFLLLVTLSFSSFLLILLSTSRLGVNLGEDSVCYILFAHGLLDHNANPELMKVLSLFFGPLFPLVLSWGGHLGVDLFQMARWANALFFALSIFLAGFILKKYISLGWLSLCGSFLILAAPDMVDIHLQAMSDPLFIVFLLLWLLFSWEYIQKPKTSILILSSIVAALSFVTRYTGITLVAAGLFVIFSLSRQMRERKIRHAIVFVFISCLPLGLFLAWNKHISGNISARSLNFHPLTMSHWQKMASVFWDWVFPRGVYAHESLFLLLIGVAGLFFAGYLLWDQAKKAPGETSHSSVFIKFSVLLIVYIFFYMISIIFAASFLDAKIDFGATRHFLPVHITLLFLFLGFMYRFFFQERDFTFRADAGKIILVYLMMFYSVHSAPYLIRQYIIGDRYATGPLRCSFIIRTIKKISLKIPVYTNDSFSIYVLARRDSFQIPSLRDALSRKKNDAYAGQFARMRDDLKNKKGILVYFNEDYTVSGVEPIEQVSREIPLHLVARDPYGAIYAI